MKDNSEKGKEKEEGNRSGMTGVFMKGISQKIKRKVKGD